MSKNSNGVTLPDPVPVGQLPQSQNEATVAHPSAMTLFAPDPNADPETVSSLLLLVYFVDLSYLIR